MQHLEEGTIHAWLDGALGESEAAAVAQHVTECSECSSLVAEARGMIAAAGRIVSALDNVPGGVIPASMATKPKQNSLWRQLRLTPARAALAATILVAAGTMLTVRSDKSQQSFQDAMTAASAPAPSQVQERDGAKPTQAPQPELQTQSKAAGVAERQQQNRQRMAAAAVDSMSQAPVAVRAANAAPRDENLAKSVTADAVAKTGRVLADTAQSRRRTPAANFATGQVAAAPPAVAPAAARSISRSSVTEGRRSSADSLRRKAIAEDRRFTTPLQLNEAVATGLASARSLTAMFEGCYQLDNDSTRAVTGLPARFALQHVADSAPNRGQNVVRAVSADGRIDTILRGSNWRVIAPDSARVRLDTASTRQPLTISLTSLSVLAPVNARGPVSLTRVACRP